MGNGGNTIGISVREGFWKKLILKTRRKLKDNIKMDLTDIILSFT
jgi:hypothetical protein